MSGQIAPPTKNAAAQMPHPEPGLTRRDFEVLLLSVHLSDGFIGADFLR